MRNITLFGLIVSVYFGHYFFIGPNNAYSVLLPSDMKLIRIDTLNGGTYNHTFLGMKKEEDFDFTISFSVIEGEIVDLRQKENVSKYEVDCNCKVDNIERILYPNFKGIMYNITKEIQNVKLAGEVYISEGKNGKSINVVCMSEFDKGKLIKSVSKPILETLVLNF